MEKEESVLENEVMKVWGKVWERTEQEPERKRKGRKETAYILNYTFEEALHFNHLAAYAVYYEVLECALWCGENCFMSSSELDTYHVVTL